MARLSPTGLSPWSPSTRTRAGPYRCQRSSPGCSLPVTDQSSSTDGETVTPVPSRARVVVSATRTLAQDARATAGVRRALAPPAPALPGAVRRPRRAWSSRRTDPHRAAPCPLAPCRWCSSTYRPAAWRPRCRRSW